MLIDSFETRDFILWDDVISSSSIVSTAGLDMKGDYCASFNESGYLRKNFSDQNELYCAFQFRTKQPTTYDCYLIIRSASIQIFQIRYHNGYLQYHYSIPYNLFVTGSKYISSNTSYFVQIYFKYADNGEVFVKIDGAIDAEYVGNTRLGYTMVVFDDVRFGDNSYFDNIILDDSEIPEETEIAILKPNGVGAYSDFVPTPSGNNYSCVDEIPYNDTDYVTSSGENAVDTYLLEDLSPHAKSIKCVQLQARVRKDSDSLLTKFNFVVRSGSTNYYRDDIVLTNTFNTYSSIFTDGPTGSGFWHPSTVDSMELGVRARA